MQCKVKYGLVWRKAEKRCKFVFVITSKIVHEENDVWALKFEIFILSLILWEISLRYDKKSVFSEICGFRLFYWMSPPDNIGPYGWVIKSGRQLFPHLSFSNLLIFPPSLLCTSHQGNAKFTIGKSSKMSKEMLACHRSNNHIRNGATTFYRVFSDWKWKV